MPQQNPTTHQPAALTARESSPTPPGRVVWSRVLRPGAGGPWDHLADDEGFRAFLAGRLREERAAAERRVLRSCAPATPLRALHLLDELIDGLDRGVLPDETTLQVLTTVHADHPELDPSWLSPTLHATL